MNIKPLQKAYNTYLLFRSKIRLCGLSLRGLKTGKNVIIGKHNKFPYFNLRNIKIKDNVTIGEYGWFFLPIENKDCMIEIGNGTNIGSRFTISSNNRIGIGKNCLFSYNVSILDHGHVFDRNLHPTSSGITEGEAIIIGNDCFVGCNATILKGVNLGNHCVVGANSVVTRSFPDNSIIGGVPAKLINTL